MNTVYAQLVDTVKPANVVEMAKKLGVTSELAPNASIALGTADVSVLDMASVYQTFQTRGLHIEPRVIRKITQNNSVLVDDRPKYTRVIDRSVAEKVNYALQQVVDAGSGTGARPAPPTSTATPGSWATPASSPPRCGWAIPRASPTSS